MAYVAEAPARASLRPEARYFYVYMALACVAVAFLGFAPTYWMPLAARTFKANPVVHFHGLIFFSWTLYLVYPTWLAASGKVARHREIGLIGVSLATAMTIFGVLVAIESAKNAAAQGAAEAGRAFMIVPVVGISFFTGTVIAAMINLRRPQWHKRLMLLATIAILPAATARWFFTFLPPPGFPGASYDFAPTCVTSLLLVAAMVYDWRTRGRPHAAYVTGGGIYAVLHLLMASVSLTQAWQSTAGWIIGLAG